MPDSFIDILAVLFNDLRRTDGHQLIGEKYRSKCCQRLFLSRVPSEYRPIATIRLFYQFFCRHDFWMGGNRTGNSSARTKTWLSGRQTCGKTKHLVTAHFVSDKLSSASVPIWIVKKKLLAWTCRRLSTEYIGQHHGALLHNNAFQNT